MIIDWFKLTERDEGKQIRCTAPAEPGYPPTSYVYKISVVMNATVDLSRWNEKADTVVFNEDPRTREMDQCHDEGKDPSLTALLTFIVLDGDSLAQIKILAGPGGQVTADLIGVCLDNNWEWADELVALQKRMQRGRKMTKTKRIRELEEQVRALESEILRLYNIEIESSRIVSDAARAAILDAAPGAFGSTKLRAIYRTGERFHGGLVHNTDRQLLELWFENVEDEYASTPIWQNFLIGELGAVAVIADLILERDLDALEATADVRASY